VKAFKRAKEWFLISQGQDPLEPFGGTVRGHERGMAWTTDRSWASDFARGRLPRHDPASGAELPSVADEYRTEVDRAVFLCEGEENPFLSDRHHERVVIVDPRLLRAVACIERLHPGAETRPPTEDCLAVATCPWSIQR
jgi:hypothetical protein